MTLHLCFVRWNCEIMLCVCRAKSRTWSKERLVFLYFSTRTPSLDIIQRDKNINFSLEFVENISLFYFRTVHVHDPSPRCGGYRDWRKAKSGCVLCRTVDIVCRTVDIMQGLNRQNVNEDISVLELTGGGVAIACLTATTQPFMLWQLHTLWTLELQTKVREHFTILEKAPTRAFTWLKAPTSAFTFKTLLRHYAKR